MVNMRRQPPARCLFAAMVCALLLCHAAGAAAGETSLLKGIVRDTDGNPVEYVSVHVYFSANTRRQPDFRSPPSGRDGRYSIALPSGRYWVVAREGKDQQAGPLLSSSRHSGEPAEIEVAPGRDREQDFVVAALKDLAKASRKTRKDVVKVIGRIIDQQGRPVKSACLLVYRDRVTEALPDFVSAWTADDGRFTLWIPPGTCCVAASMLFPPLNAELSCRRMTMGADQAAVDVVLAPGKRP